MIRRLLRSWLGVDDVERLAADAHSTARRADATAQTARITAARPHLLTDDERRSVTERIWGS